MPVKTSSSSASVVSQQQPSSSSTTITTTSTTTSSSPYSVDILPIVSICNQTSVSNDPKIIEFIKLFEKQNIEEYFTFVSENQDFLSTHLNLSPYDFALLYRRLMIWKLLKFEVYVSLETLREKLRCNNVDQVIEAMKDIHNYDHYLNKTLKVQINRFFKLSATPKALMSEGIVDFMIECSSYRPGQVSNELPVNTAATTLGVALAQDSLNSVKTLRIMLEIYRTNRCERNNVISIFKATSAILGNGHPSLIYVDIGICSLHTRQECQDVLPYANRCIEYMTTFPCMRYSKAFFKISSLISNETQQRLVEAITTGDLDKIRNSQLSLSKIEMLIKISRIYKLIHLVDEKEIHNVIDLCKDLQFSSAEEILAFLIQCRDYITTESNEYGAYLVPNTNAIVDATRNSSTK
jgi:hypothetical protein